MRRILKKLHTNKGFTLVELIVVIAVLGVITVLAIPQFTGYVETSKQGTDRNAVKEVAHAAEVAYTAIRAKNPDDNMFMMTINPDGVASYGPVPTVEPAAIAEENTTTLSSEVERVLPASSYVYKSKLYRGIPASDQGSHITFVVDKTTGVATITTDSYSEYMSAQLALAQAELEAKQDAHDTAVVQHQATKTVVEGLQTTIDNLKPGIQTIENGLGALEDALESSTTAAELAYNAEKERLELDYNTKKELAENEEGLRDAALQAVSYLGCSYAGEVGSQYCTTSHGRLTKAACTKAVDLINSAATLGKQRDDAKIAYDEFATDGAKADYIANASSVAQGALDKANSELTDLKGQLSEAENSLEEETAKLQEKEENLKNTQAELDAAQENLDAAKDAWGEYTTGAGSLEDHINQMG